MPARVGRRGFRSRAEETGHLVRSPVRSPRSAMGSCCPSHRCLRCASQAASGRAGGQFPRGVEPNCQPANVLLVESSQKTLDVVARLLRQSSFKLNLDFSGTAREALKALVPEFYDIAFVNLALADGSGVETALRVIARSPRTRIITFGNPDRFTAATLKSLGVAAHLPVPFEPHALELALHDLFGLWRPYLLQAIDQADKSDQTGLNDLRKVRA